MHDSQPSIASGGSPFAGFFRRMTAASIDSTLLGIPIYIVIGARGATLIPLFNKDLENFAEAQEAFVTALSAEMVQIATIAAALFFVYKTGFEASGMRATIGKLLTGLRVTNQQGNRLSIPAAAVRGWPLWAPAALFVLDARYGFDGMLRIAAVMAALLACAAVAVTPRKRGIHDMMAGALVVRAGARFEEDPTTL
jgi:uncharacterized RDD family membrane protein YckC